jgi:hypothetical protein
MPVISELFLRPLALGEVIIIKKRDKPIGCGEAEVEKSGCLDI